MMNNVLRPYEEMKNSYKDWLAEVPNHWRLAKAKRIFRETFRVDRKSYIS